MQIRSVQSLGGIFYLKSLYNVRYRRKVNLAEITLCDANNDDNNDNDNDDNYTLLLLQYEPHLILAPRPESHGFWVSGQALMCGSLPEQLRM